MAIEEGLGNCPICGLKIEVGQPAQYFKSGKTHGGAMAHTRCVTEHNAKVNTPEYKREQAQAKVDRCQAALAAAVAHLRAAEEELAQCPA